MSRPSSLALLLSQLGSHVAGEFARRLEPLGLTPAHVGVLRTLAVRPGINQQELAEVIGAVPSRVVKLLDELGARGLVERRRSEIDRRHHELHLSPAARSKLDAVMATVVEHDRAIGAGLTAEEKRELVALLGKLAEARGLGGLAHPGFRGSET
ncbi:DNA-binding MarR family transcriptional regulator [Marmoricola sp. OAE513]|uniref:MarR family winged helix-turn-helix transcriptional regulator n=1 Tax=Marmoricola sp. OAE513 TaxID=2817894 RepID=UPI001AE53B5D